MTCLICGTPIVHSHMGIDSCRACAIFYKRAINLKYQLRCYQKDEDCLRGGSCRKCRFDRFDDLYVRASDGQKKLLPISNQSHILEATSSTQFCIESKDTPLLNRMKKTYRTLCRARNWRETGVLEPQAIQFKRNNAEMILHSAKYSDIIPYANIFRRCVLDFAKTSFENFRKLPGDSQLELVQCNFQLLQSLDGSYRAHRLFPDDDAIMASYTTFLNDDALVAFFDDCPNKINKKEAIEQMRKNLKQTFEKAKNAFRKFKPSIDEFIALFGLTLCNDHTSSLSPKLSRYALEIRTSILNELHKVYTLNGVSDYAVRLGELLCLLANEERILDLTNEHVQMYRLMNLFNKAFDDTTHYDNIIKT